jgi:hypothetical protein
MTDERPSTLSENARHYYQLIRYLQNEGVEGTKYSFPPSLLVKNIAFNVRGSCYMLVSSSYVLPVFFNIRYTVMVGKAFMLYFNK